MKVKCIANSGKDLSGKSLALGYTVESRFDELKIGESYFVYGMHVYEGMISYLLIDEEINRPFWYPAELFVVSDHRLPVEWYFNYYGDREDYLVSAVWGYKELALDENHHDGLLEREPEDMKIFFARKKEMEESM